ncbi:MAG TPA: ABC transporter ATP-binding protein [Thermomicrobiales bacterium]|nr:ABC transporter ATP-binding protein [Thermomicrobiales bacterium]
MALATAIPAGGAAGTVDAVVVDRVTKVFRAEKKRAWRFPPWRAAGAGEEDGGGARDERAGKPVLAVDHVSLTIRKNEIYGVLGSNGSGKSTLIRLLSTLLIPDEGHVTVFGHDVVRDEAQVKRLINRVSVEASFFKKLSPLENLYYAIRLYGMEGRATKPAIVRLLRDLGIDADRLDRPLEEMSRGMQQKVAIARAFLTSPVLLLLDEPTTGLDPRSKRDVQRFVLDLRGRHDATILLTTHDMEEADALCERIAILDRGKIVVEATPAELKRLAATPDQPSPSLEDAFMRFTGHAAREDESRE